MARPINFDVILVIIALIVLFALAAKGPNVFSRSPGGERAAARAAKPSSPHAGAAEIGEQRMLQVGSEQRAYYLHRPAGAASSALPLVIVFHGGEGSPQKIAAQTGFNEVADRNGFAVAYPASIDHWNDGRDATAKFGDDTRFTSELIDALAGSDGIDRTRVYATGASNGGLMTLRLACERANEIAAFAAVAASFPDSYMSHCKPARPVPLLIIHGSDDRLIPRGGGTIPSGRRAGLGGTVNPLPDTLEFWRQADGCQPQPSVKTLPDAADDGTTVKVMEYQGCAPAAGLIFVDVVGGGHTWPGTRVDPVGRLAGRISRDIDASQYIWDFFRGHRLAENRE
jgi:polyhydroxybutyrate depolymerase